MSYPSSVADRVLDELGISNPDDLKRLDLIAWERGAIINERPLKGSEARIVIAGKRAIISVSTSINNLHRKRFSVAHELGHLELHRYRSPLALCLSDDLNDWRMQPSGENLESEANSFASALLLPERFFAHLCADRSPSLDYISKLGEDFNVSLTATSLRWLQFSDDAAAIVFSKDGHIKWFHESALFKETREDLDFFIDVRSRLDPASLASYFFRGYDIPKRQGKIPVETWFTPGKYSPGATIIEHSIAMPKYNSVLTLLWIDDDIDDEIN